MAINYSTNNGQQSTIMLSIINIYEDSTRTNLHAQV
jgi:hypothetical protein